MRLWLVGLATGDVGESVCSGVAEPDDISSVLRGASHIADGDGFTVVDIAFRLGGGGGGGGRRDFLCPTEPDGSGDWEGPASSEFRRTEKTDWFE